MSSYHDILGVPRGAGKEQVKRAFRKKAMQYHPDKNNAPGAKDMFIKVNEAYEALIEGRAMPRQRARRTKTRQEMQEEIRRKAKAQAKYYAKMRYEEFRKECKAFRKSVFYYPAMFLYYSVYVFIISIAVVMLLGMLAGVLSEGKHDHMGLELIAAFFVVLFSVIVVAMAMRFRKILEPYFKDYD